MPLISEKTPLVQADEPWAVAPRRGGDDPPPGIMRRVAYWVSMVVFVVILLYASGAPFVVLSILQQCDRLPDTNNRIFWMVAFPPPLGPQFVEDEPIDLLAIQYLSLAIPFFWLAMLWEQFIIFVVLLPHQRPLHVFRFNDAMGSLSLGTLNMLFLSVYFFDWTFPLYTFVHEHMRITDAMTDTSKPLNWWLCLVVGDFTYYCTHWGYHQISWLWLSHVVHHSSEEYNLTTALRQPVGDIYTPAFFIRGILAATLFPWKIWVVHETFSLLYQFWIHTQLIPALPIIELVFNTPSLHRIHHARNVRALGKNYGAIFSIWDRIFQTFEPEHRHGDTEPIYYGIIPPLNSWNPWWAHIHHACHMFGKQYEWQGILALFKKWTPAGGTVPKLGSKMNPYTKYDEYPEDPWWTAYAFLQFFFVSVGATVSSFAALNWTISIVMTQFPSLGYVTVEAIVSLWILVLAFWGLRNIGCMMDAKGTRVRSMLHQEVVRNVVTTSHLIPLTIFLEFQRRRQHAIMIGVGGGAYLFIVFACLAVLHKRQQKMFLGHIDGSNTKHVGYTEWYHAARYQGSR